MHTEPNTLTRALWRIYNRPDPSPLWQGGGNLPWNDPAFSARMLREHLDESHRAWAARHRRRLQPSIHRLCSPTGRGAGNVWAL